jgi:hypothetical protein
MILPINLSTYQSIDWIWKYGRNVLKIWSVARNWIWIGNTICSKNDSRNVIDRPPLKAREGVGLLRSGDFSDLRLFRPIDPSTRN